MITSSEEQKDKKAYWQNELKSLGIDSKRINELDGNEELENLVDVAKQSMVKDYKKAYLKDDKHKEY